MSRGATLDEHIRSLLDMLESKAGVIKHLSSQYRVGLFCGFGSASGQGGFTLDVVTLARVAALGIPLGLDIYPLGAEGGMEGK